jgi:hypothetical protein
MLDILLEIHKQQINILEELQLMSTLLVAQQQQDQDQNQSNKTRTKGFQMHALPLAKRIFHSTLREIVLKQQGWYHCQKWKFSELKSKSAKIERVS